MAHFPLTDYVCVCVSIIRIPIQWVSKVSESSLDGRVAQLSAGCDPDHSPGNIPWYICNFPHLLLKIKKWVQSATFYYLLLLMSFEQANICFVRNHGESFRLVAIVERFYSPDIRLLSSSPRTPDATQAQLVLLQPICELFIPLQLFK